MYNRRARQSISGSLTNTEKLFIENLKSDEKTIDEKLESDNKNVPHKWFSKWDKYVYTICILVNYLNYGLSSSMFSPAMVDMKFLFHTSMASIVYTNTFFSAGYLVGCLSGFLYSYINRQLSLTILTIILAVFSALSPFCTNIWLLYASVFIASIGGGAWDSGNSVWTIELWKENSPPVLQLAQMMFGLGNILSPIIARDYLLGDMSNCTDAVDYSLQVTGLGRHYFNRHHPKHHPHTHRPPPHHLTTTVAPFVCPDDDPINYSIDRRPRLKVPFLIAGGVTLIVPVIWIIMFAIKRYQVPKTRERVDSRVADPTGKTVQKITTDKSPILMPARRTKIILIILVGMSLNSYSAMEQSFLNNSSTYYQYLPIRLSAQEAADVLSVMTSTYTVGRLISAFIASKLSAEVMLVYHSVIICVSMAILQFGQHSKAFIWAGNALIGFGYSAMWPSYIAFGEKYIKLNDKITSIFAFISTTIPFINPFIIGPLIEDHPHVFLDLEFVYFVITILLLIALLIIAKRSQRYPEVYTVNKLDKC